MSKGGRNPFSHSVFLWEKVAVRPDEGVVSGFGYDLAENKAIFSKRAQNSPT
jgi:hypothetical protein